ncbi:MAG: YqeG family HAD IIIA-type phosphatase [Turicibacter sp.]|nr:YqeG family HAD IIIA-type phosphatase [Turicibacter sp.]
MGTKLKPDFYLESIFHVPYNQLYKEGIRSIIYDIDNTLVTHADITPPEKITALVKQLNAMGFKVALLSNNNKKRLNAFNEPMNLPGASMALKPFTASLKKLMREMETEPTETAIIGDQLLADIWCGKNAGLTTVLVKPIAKKEVFTAKLKRGLERKMLRHYYESKR